MPKRKDALIIAAVLVIAAALLVVSRLMPKTNLEEKTADVTLAPDAIEYIEATTEPTEATTEPTEAPTEAPAEPTEAPAEPTEAPTEAPAEPTEAPTTEPTEAPTAEPTEAPAQAAMVGPMPAPQTAEVKGHVVITIGSRQYGEPIPMDREKVITVKQDNGQINKVHITPEKVYMEYSTCDNQDCVGQGEITMDNYETRILSTFVICLPNNVTVEMVPVE